MELPVCKCCGQTLPGAFDFEGVPLTHQQTMIAKRIWEAGNAGATIRMLINHIYAGVANGGAINAKNVVHAQVSYANAKLKLAGWQIKANRRGGAGAVFRMVRL